MRNGWSASMADSKSTRTKRGLLAAAKGGERAKGFAERPRCQAHKLYRRELPGTYSLFFLFEPLRTDPLRSSSCAGPCSRSTREIKTHRFRRGGRLGSTPLHEVKANRLPGRRA